MIILIDGYNFIRTLFSQKSNLEKMRKKLIEMLIIYKKHKDNEIVLVFDGGLISRATREIKKGVVIIFAGQKMSADEWIVDYCRRNKNKEMVLVTRDRELIKRAGLYNVDPLEVDEFYALIKSYEQQHLSNQLAKGSTLASYNIEKYERDEDEIDADLQSELDWLMSNAMDENISKEDNVVSHKKKQSHTLSKKERTFQKKIRKL